MIESKSLMVGDWVERFGKKFQIKAHQFTECNFEPIRLTAEILEKNGWEETAYWHEYKDGTSTMQACLPDMRGIINGIEIQHFKCKYVHQYQRLLRLCGLNELADNFKI